MRFLPGRFLFKTAACLSLLCLASCSDDEEDYDDSEEPLAVAPASPPTGEKPEAPSPEMPSSWPRLTASIRQKGLYAPAPSAASACDTPEGMWKHWISLQETVAGATDRGVSQDVSLAELAERGGEYIVLKDALLQAISEEARIPLETVKECFARWKNAHAFSSHSQTDPQS